MSRRAAALRALLAEPVCRVMPCCFDAMSARLIEQAGFPMTFMSGFATSVAKIGKPDAGLISYGEMADQGRDICEATSIPVIGESLPRLDVQKLVIEYADTTLRQVRKHCEADA